MTHKRGQRLLPVVLDHLAQDTPERIYASVPRTNDLKDGFRDISVKEVSAAVHACAWWLHDTLGRSENFKTLAYVGVNDLRYTVFWFASIKCGYKVLLLSPRNTIAQNVSLMNQTQCRKFFCTSQFGVLGNDLQDALRDSFEVATYDIAPFGEWVAEHTVPYEYRKNFEEARDDPIITVHSSGSTGDPKPITNTHGWFAGVDQPLHEVDGRELGGISLLDFEGGGGYYSPFPGFHIAGITALAFYPIMWKSAHVILGLPDRPPSIDMVHTILIQKQPRVLYLPPSIIEGLCQIPSSLESMKNAESVLFTGGPLARPVGDMLSQHVKLSSSYGSTEMGNIACLLPKDRADWEWLEWHPALRVDMQPTIDKASEFVLNSDKEADRFRPISSTILREEATYHSRDLFRPHPTKQNMWQFYSRNDDILVLSNGEKFNPIPTEGVVQSHSHLTGALVIGNGEFQPAIMVEPKERPLDKNRLVADVWPLIAKANADAQRFGRITRHMVMVVPPASFVRAPKGTIVRTLTIQKLHVFVERLYKSDRSTLSTSVDDMSLYQVKVRYYEDVLDFVRQCFHEVSSLPEIDDDTDLYVHGFDSLETLELARLLTRKLSPQYTLPQLDFLTPRYIFDNPSLQDLATSIHFQLNSGHASGDISFKAIKYEMDSLVRKYRAFQASKDHQSHDNSAGKAMHVILTGSTGSLGQQILYYLASTPNISKITCIDRSSTASRTKGLATLSGSHPSLLSKVHFLQARLDMPYHGLKDEEQATLVDANIVIHNAWKVDFNQSLASFEPLLFSIRHIASWASNTNPHPRIVFISSIAAVADYRGSHIPEQVSNHSPVPTTGYGQSKHVAERLLSLESEALNLPVTILRVGQVAGSTPSDSSPISKPWNQSDWLPALVHTSKHLRKLPAELPIPVDWLPSDVVAHAVMDIVAHEASNPAGKQCGVYNVLNPSVTQWSALAPHVRDALTHQAAEPAATTQHIDLVPFSAWFTSVQEIADKLTSGDATMEERARMAELYPAVKLIRCFEDLRDLDREFGGGIAPAFDVTKAAGVSSALARVGAIKAEWMVKWVAEWEL